MADGYILEAKDKNGEFLAYFIANESDEVQAKELVKAISLAESVDVVKHLNKSEIASWQAAFRSHPRTENFELTRGTCLDLATWMHN
jgi:hypothetical protein